MAKPQKLSYAYVMSMKSPSDVYSSGISGNYVLTGAAAISMLGNTEPLLCHTQFNSLHLTASNSCLYLIGIRDPTINPITSSNTELYCAVIS